MVIKSMSRKTRSFGQVLAYIRGAEVKGKELLWNVRGEAGDLRGIERAFLDNARLGRERANRVMLFHEVLAFAGADRDSLTPDILDDLTRQYLGRRAPEALAYAQAHYDTDGPHVHILISGNQVGQDRQTHLTKAEFRDIKREVEAYQRRQYPELRYSIAQDQEKNQAKRRAEDERERRLRKAGKDQPSEKERVGRLVREAMGLPSLQAAAAHLRGQGFELYERGKTAGIVAPGGRRYRLSTLGLADAFTEACDRWKVATGRLQELAGIAEERTAKLVREQGIRGAVTEVLDGGRHIRMHR